MTRRLLLLLSLTCAVGVGTIYFPQAITPLIASGLGTSQEAAAVVVTATQIGYTAGIFLLVPLGDRLAGRPLLVALLGLAGLGLLVAGCAPTLPVLTAASVAVGITAVAAQVVSPMAAGLVPAERRGAVIGTLMSGSTGGMLLARAFGGTLGEWLGWRAPYLAAGALTLLLAAVLTRALPDVTAVAPAVRPSYRALLAAPVRLLRTEPELRRSGFYQATVFAGFSAVWTCLPLLLTGPAYGLDARAVGLVALVGAATMVCTPFAGRVVDRRGADPVNLVCLLGTLAAAAVLLAGGGTDGRGGPGDRVGGGAVGLVVLVSGTLLLDVAMQSGMIANKTRVYELRADARGRLNTAYMTFGYLGGSVGSWLGLRAHVLAGWPGVCGLLALLAALALARHLTAARGPRERARALPEEPAGEGGRTLPAGSAPAPTGPSDAPADGVGGTR
ncbi:MFS transporter [Kitasatospora sp. NPDC056327]|uniref:MFS transporter n=1 Tax=Kitasatospora sp. NPDC056327 TaxID=3345785 RepID=UPI0035DB321F